MRFFRNFLVFLGACVVLLFITSLILVLKTSRQTVEHPLTTQDKVILRLKLEGKIVHRARPGQLLEVLIDRFGNSDEGPYLPVLRETLVSAALDERVKGLFIELGNLDGALSDFSELRSLLKEFKDSKKPIQIWAPQLDTKQYYLSSVGDEIYLPTLGEIHIPGPVLEFVYLGDLFSKIGIGFEVLRSGKFKAAFDPLVQNGPSEAAKEMYASLEGNLREHIVASIAKDRTSDTTNVSGWLKRSFYTSAEALAGHLIDGVAYSDQAEKQMLEAKGCTSYAFADYVGQEPFTITKDKTPKVNDAIAVIEAMGEIFLDDRGDMGEGITPSRLQEEFEWALADETVKAIVLRISSPGGSALASDLIAEQVKRATETKPVVVSMGAYGASGGYYISAPATKIFAEPTTITGSIGVIGLLPNVENLAKKYGVAFDVITASDRRNLYNPGTKPSAEDKALLNASIEVVYQTFLKRVADGRSMTVKDVDEIAQGRVWTGGQAKTIGLIDEIGGLHEATVEAANLVHLENSRKPNIVRYEPKDGSMLRCVLHRGWRGCLTNRPRAQIPEMALWLQELETIVTQKRERVLLLLPHFTWY